MELLLGSLVVVALVLVARGLIKKHSSRCSDDHSHEIPESPESCCLENCGQLLSLEDRVDNLEFKVLDLENQLSNKQDRTKSVDQVLESIEKEIKKEKKKSPGSSKKKKSPKGSSK